MMLQDDLVAHPESEAGSCNFFGREEGLEDVLADLGLHACAGVGNGKADSGLLWVLPIAGTAGAQQQAATCAAGVDGVAHQVGEHLADLSGKAEEAQLRLVVALHANVERVDASLIEAQHGV